MISFYWTGVHDCLPTICLHLNSLKGSFSDANGWKENKNVKLTDDLESIRSGYINRDQMCTTSVKKQQHHLCCWLSCEWLTASNWNWSSCCPVAHLYPPSNNNNSRQTCWNPFRSAQVSANHLLLQATTRLKSSFGDSLLSGFHIQWNWELRCRDSCSLLQSSGLIVIVVSVAYTGS